MSRKIIWTFEANIMLEETIEYWNERNQSSSYSEKILDEINIVQEAVIKNPLFLARFHSHVNLYQKIFFKGKFSIFYKILDDEIIVIHFRSNRQKPL